MFNVEASTAIVVKRKECLEFVFHFQDVFPILLRNSKNIKCQVVQITKVDAKLANLNARQWALDHCPFCNDLPKHLKPNSIFKQNKSDLNVSSLAVVL